MEKRHFKKKKQLLLQKSFFPLALGGIASDSKEAFFAKLQWKRFFTITGHMMYRIMWRSQYVWTKQETEIQSRRFLSGEIKKPHRFEAAEKCSWILRPTSLNYGNVLSEAVTNVMLEIMENSQTEASKREKWISEPVALISCVKYV